MIINLEVRNECDQDAVVNLKTISDQLYYIAESRVVTFEPTWSSNITGCPLVQEIARIENGIARSLNPQELAVITHSLVDGVTTLETSEYSLDGEVWTIKILKRSLYSTGSQAEGAYIFDIEFRDICWDSILQAAEFYQLSHVYDLWQD